jgi:uncharacterized phage protein gp47/JayE
LRRSDGVQFSVDLDTNLSGGAASVAITAGRGAAVSNTLVGIQLTFVSEIDGVDATATVEDDGDGGGLTGGADRETDALLLTRILARIQNPPHGGTQSDYEQWTLSVAGVTRAWAFPITPGLGQVTIFFAVDDDPTGPIPDAAKVTEVQTYVDTVRPVAAEVLVTAPTEQELSPTIELTPDTATVRQAVEDAIVDLLEREVEVGGILRISVLREAISTAAGETYHVLTDPTVDVDLTAGKLLTVGTITWA